MTIQEFKTKYGTKTLGLFVSEFINRSPEFQGDEQLAKALGEIIADLESALEQVSTK